MALRYRIDIIKALKEKGITTYTMRREKILSESTIQKLREGKGIAWENIDQLCRLLNCQPGDLFEYVPDDAGAAEQPSACADPIGKTAYRNNEHTTADLVGRGCILGCSNEKCACKIGRGSDKIQEQKEFRITEHTLAIHTTKEGKQERICFPSFHFHSFVISSSA